MSYSRLNTHDYRLNANDGHFAYANIITIQESRGPCCGIDEPDRADMYLVTVLQAQEHRPARVFEMCRVAITVNRSIAFNGNRRCIFSTDQAPVPMTTHFYT